MPRRKPTDDPTDRLGDALGGTGDRLPGVGLATLRRFHAYLTVNLPLPFAGRLGDPRVAEPQFRLRDVPHLVQVLQLVDRDPDRAAHLDSREHLHDLR